MLCDTDFLIGLLRSNPSAIAKLEDLIQQEIIPSTTHLNLCELFKGAYRTLNPKKAVATIHQLLEYFRILPFSIEADEEAGRILAELTKKGTPIGDIDAIIASIAEVNNETIITNNTKHFEKTKVPIEAWAMK